MSVTTAPQPDCSIQTAKRLVIKVGSSLLVSSGSGHIRRQWLESLCADVARFRQRGQEVVIVTSGAVAVGRRHLRLTPPLQLDEKQAAAATGQIQLAHAYDETLGRHGLTVAQILLTLEDSEDRRRYLNARNTLSTLLRLGAIPLINENDTVATTEIRFGDNDRLAARVAQMVNADLLVLFSDIDGLYSADPRKDPNAAFFPVIHEITPEIEAMAGDPSTGYGSGGMITKLTAAKMCVSAGCAMIITHGEKLSPLTLLENNGKHTLFIPHSGAQQTARKQWILGSMNPDGAYVVDDGAAHALTTGKSLLPVGVTAVEGPFSRGDCVRILDQNGQILARGLTNYHHREAEKIIGKHSDAIEGILGYNRRNELIHRDDMVVEGT